MLHEVRFGIADAISSGSLAEAFYCSFVFSAEYCERVVVGLAEKDVGIPGCVS
jgi:hypothetical protein